MPAPLPALLPALLVPLVLLPGPTPSTSSTTPAPAPTAGLTAVPVGTGVWPLAPRPRVVSGFDPPRTTYGRGHRGVDLQGRPDQSVRASLGGRISFAAPLAGRGVVVVQHGFGRTTYQPVRASVEVGQQVARGQVIGTLRPGGSHCAPRSCLHWGLLRGEAYLDPLVLVGAVPVRLLPLTGPLTGPGWGSSITGR